MTNRKIVLYIAQSLDGYIATREDSLDWLLSVEGEGDNGYGAFYDTVDTIIMGRRTYDWIMTQEKGHFPYYGKECYVCSHTPEKANEFVTFLSDDIASFTRSLTQTTGKKIWLVGGAGLIDYFQENHLIDELIVNIAPVVLGDGIPLFLQEPKDQLHFLGSKQFGQFIELTYEFKKES